MSERPLDPSAHRKSARLSAKAGVSSRAQAPEDAAEARARAERWRRWREANAAAIQDANAFVAEHGVFSDGLRAF